MKRLKAVVLSACVGASMWIVVAPSPASACDRYPCHPACRLTPGSYLENGNINPDGRPFECYY
jgi:hypothetical protein